MRPNFSIQRQKVQRKNSLSIILYLFFPIVSPKHMNDLMVYAFRVMGNFDDKHEIGNERDWSPTLT